MIASNELGESDLAEDVVKVREPSGTKMPEASFVFFPTAPLAGEPVTFVSTSTDPDSPIPAGALRWDLDGDGLFDDATGPSVAVSFPVAATYLIALQVTTNAKDVATLALPVGDARRCARSALVLADEPLPGGPHRRPRLEEGCPYPPIEHRRASRGLQSTCAARGADVRSSAPSGRSRCASVPAASRPRASRASGGSRDARCERARS